MIVFKSFLELHILRPVYYIVEDTVIEQFVGPNLTDACVLGSHT